MGEFFHCDDGIFWGCITGCSFRNIKKEEFRLMGSLVNSYLNYRVSIEVKSLILAEELQFESGSEVNHTTRGFGQDSIQGSGWEHKHQARLSIPLRVPLLMPWPVGWHMA